jgi:hypothetical protein
MSEYFKTNSEGGYIRIAHVNLCVLLRFAKHVIPILLVHIDGAYMTPHISHLHKEDRYFSIMSGVL